MTKAATGIRGLSAAAWRTLRALPHTHFRVWGGRNLPGCEVCRGPLGVVHSGQYRRFCSTRCRRARHRHSAVTRIGA